MELSEFRKRKVLMHGEGFDFDKILSSVQDGISNIIKSPFEIKGKYGTFETGIKNGTVFTTSNYNESSVKSEKTSVKSDKSNIPEFLKYIPLFSPLIVYFLKKK